MLDPTNERAFADDRKSTGRDARGKEKSLFSGVSDNADPTIARISALVDPNPAIGESTKAAAARALSIRLCESGCLESLKARIRACPRIGESTNRTVIFRRSASTYRAKPFSKPPEMRQRFVLSAMEGGVPVYFASERGQSENRKKRGGFVLSAIRKRKDRGGLQPRRPFCIRQPPAW